MLVECRGQLAPPKRTNNKSEFCTYCNHYAVTSPQKVCMCCNQKIIRKSTYDSVMQRFDCVIESNENLLELYKKSETPKDMVFEKRIKIGMWWYFVSMDWFIQYTNLSTVQQPDKYEKFFTKLKETCPRIA